MVSRCRLYLAAADGEVRLTNREAREPGHFGKQNGSRGDGLKECCHLVCRGYGVVSQILAALMKMARWEQNEPV